MKFLFSFLLLVFTFAFSFGQCFDCQLRLEIDGCSLTVKEYKTNDVFIYDRVIETNCNDGKIKVSNGITTREISYNDVRFPRGISASKDSLCSFIDALIDCTEEIDVGIPEPFCLECPVKIDSMPPIEIIPSDAATGNQVRNEVTAGTYQIAANAYWTYVRNAGCVDITVNGQTISPNGVYQCGSQFDNSNHVIDFCPVVDIIIPSDGEAWFSAFFPSN